MNILVTGGAGYIGSIACVQLIEAGLRPVILDSLVNAKAAVLDRIERVSGQRPVLVQADVRDRIQVVRTLHEYAIDAVIHFAGLKAVGESVAQPLRYYVNNVQGTLVLMDAMREVGVRTLVFSSSATVYAEGQEMPLRESARTGASNPYGRSKLMVEQMLADVVASDSSWSITALRYFNPVGAHPSGMVGEDPQGVPNNLMPKWRSSDCRLCAFWASITPRTMGPVCVTTSTSWIWPMGIWLLCATRMAVLGCMCSTWVLVRGTVCWTC